MSAQEPGRRVRRFDLVVIGGGLGGQCAAISAARRGLEVAVVRKGLGVTAMASGALDFPACLPPLFGGPGHGDAFAVDEADVDEAFGEFRAWMASAGLVIEGRPGEDLRLMDVAGNVRRSSAAPAGIAAGRLDRWPARGSGGRLLLLGLDGYGPFRPDWVARRVVAHGLLDPDQVATSRIIVPGPVGKEANLPAARIARTLEQPETARRFAALVAAEAAEAGAAWVALPPVLGGGPDDALRPAVAAAVAEATSAASAGAPCVFELLSPPPSVPGQRLQRALDGAARSAGVELLSGSVTGWVADADQAAGGRRIAAISVASVGRTTGLEAAEFILATGRLVAGGLDGAGGLLTEPVFGLTVWAPAPPGWPAGALPVGRRPARELVWARFRARHPVFEAGLAVDPDLRPLDGEGRVELANLRAAGSVIGGHNHFADGSGSGVAVVTGIHAGRLAAKAVLGSRDAALERGGRR